jgi:GTPase
MSLCIAIVGRPNVGKSTLFNRYVGNHTAIVADVPGVTRDRNYKQTWLHNTPVTFIDTAGIAAESQQEQAQTLNAHSLAALIEADAIWLLVDGQHGLHPDDKIIAHQCRIMNKPVWLVVNKVDGLDSEQAKGDFYSLGFDQVHALSSAHGIGTRTLMQAVIDFFKASPKHSPPPAEQDQTTLKLAILGKPNVGKSTFMNQMLCQTRSIVSNQPGTTRDCIEAEFFYGQQSITLIDTAGLRRKARVSDHIEKIACLKSLATIKQADVVIMMLDARTPLTDQDRRLINAILKEGKACVIGLNCWDQIAKKDRQLAYKCHKKALEWVSFLPIVTLSALSGYGKHTLLKQALEVFFQANRKLNTAQLTQILTQAIATQPPPYHKGRRIKPRLAHPAGFRPPTIVIQGKQTKSLPSTYQRYLAQCFRQALNLTGNPIQFIFKEDANPYVTTQKKHPTQTNKKAQKSTKNTFPDKKKSPFMRKKSAKTIS